MSKNVYKIIGIAFIFLVIISSTSQVVERFPKPDFKSGYVRPVPTAPEPRALGYEYLDVLVLLGALSLASYFALKTRSRKHIFLLMVFSLIYFGYWREGCVCSIGSIQNMTIALFDSSYAIPLVVVAFFVFPLLFTLFFGRTFCAAVCPLGAIQDVVVMKHSKVPRWLSEVLGLFPYIYLGLAILFAANGAGFIICQYDPFVGFFRFGAEFNMVVFGASLLILGTVVARPYCRFLCPYGVLLKWMSRLSKKHVSITPTECTNCRLCEASCPFDAIDKPDEAEFPEPKKSSVRRLVILFSLIPVIIIGSGWVVSNLHIPLSRQHSVVSLAEEIIREDSGEQTVTTLETRTFRSQNKTTQELITEARSIQDEFKTGGWFLGVFLGIIFSIKLVNLSIRKKHIEYTANTGTCYSCARCFDYCPFEQERIVSLNRTSILNEF
jgi:formate hydrogenlyase subunit 6/NADH:ubiquinone oxidoreductase subunit I